MAINATRIAAIASQPARRLARSAALRAWFSLLSGFIQSGGALGGFASAGFGILFGLLFCLGAAISQFFFGRVLLVIRVFRDKNWMFGGDADSKSFAPIAGFEVEDDGIGFTAENFESFETCDSLHKESRGAKGIGRLLWLKAFTSVRISSSFRSGSAFQLREFRFGLPNGVHGERITPLNGDTADTCTKVVLDGYEDTLAGNCSKKTGTIADRLLTHFATNFRDVPLTAEQWNPCSISEAAFLDISKF